MNNRWFTSESSRVVLPFHALCTGDTLDSLWLNPWDSSSGSCHLQETKQEASQESLSFPPGVCSSEACLPSLCSLSKCSSLKKSNLTSVSVSSLHSKRQKYVPRYIPTIRHLLIAPGYVHCWGVRLNLTVAQAWIMELTAERKHRSFRFSGTGNSNDVEQEVSTPADDSFSLDRSHWNIYSVRITCT